MKTLHLLFLSLLSLNYFSASACSPCGALQNVTQTVNGSNLELTFTSNAGWVCCYTVQIEIVCSNANFTGIPNYFSQEICLNGGGAPSTTTTTTMAYPLTVIDLSTFCPGTYKWRATETGCGFYTSVYEFTVVGASPIVVDANVAEAEICIGENTQLSGSASGGCNNGVLSYAWSPSAGLSNPNIANPIATPSVNTTYTLTVTESGSCTAPSSDTVHINVNPLPTASILGTTDLCVGSTAPEITFEGYNGTPPYTISYTLNGTPQTAVVTSGTTATIQAPNSPVGNYIYSLTGVQDSSPAICSQNQNGSALVVVNPLPVVSAGEDQVLCEPNDTSPSEITLNGSGAESYVWNNGVTDGVPFIPPAGTTTVYTVVGTDANGCENTDQVSVTSLTLPVANGAASPVFGNAPISVEFTNLSQGASLYTWEFGDGTTSATIGTETVGYTYNVPGIYTVTLTASNGICFDVWSIDIEVLPPMEVIPTNIFTPNGDNSNDEYFVILRYAAEFEGEIFNRWGELIATMNGITDGWDGKTTGGKTVEEGVYFIKYIARDFSGKEQEGQTYFHLVR